MSEIINTWMVYRHTSPSGKVYIGISKNSPTTRWGRNGNGYRKTQYFAHAIQKYGWDNIKHEVLFQNLSEDKAKQLEINLIRHYKNLGISYNITNGGEGTLGWHPSEELKAHWSGQRKGRIIDADWRKKLSDSLKGRVIPIETCKKGGQRNKEAKSKAVIQLSLTGEYIATFSSIKEAAKSLGNIAKDSDIIKCCKGQKISCCEFFWIYKESYDSFVKNGIINDIVQNQINLYLNRRKYIRTEEFRKSMSEKNKGKMSCSQEHMELLKKIGPEAAKKCVLQLSIDNVPIKAFRSAVEAKNSSGISKASISRCCNGVKDTACGFKFKFITKEEYEEYKESLEAA